MRQKQNSWIEKISRHVQELNEIPLFGNAPPLNLEKISSLLAEQFGSEDFSVRIKAQAWREPKDIKKGLGTGLLITPVTISPIEAPVYWVISKADRDKLTGHMLSDKPKKKAFSSSILQEGYYRYLLLEALNALQNIEPINQMTLHLEEDENLESIASVCIDVEISFGDCICWGRLIIPETFRKNWVQHFSAFPPQYVKSALSKKLPLEIGIKIGSIKLLQKEWESLKTGDFLVPDEIAQDGDVREGVLTLENTSLFQVTMNHHKIELTDYAFTTEDIMQESETQSPDNLSHKLEMAEKESKALKDLPMQVHVEIARLRITLDELMNLAPGNMLELPTHADKKVALTVNGEKIGLAELVYLGETLGLKILEI